MTDRIADRTDGDEGPPADPDVSEPAADDVAGTHTWWERRRGHRHRVSRWDRPPEPKDWRYVVGTVGKVLIATGLLMFGFVAYQLWGTGIETARAQDRLESAFEVAVASNAVDRVPPSPTTIVDEGPDEPEPDVEPDEPEPVITDPEPSEAVPDDDVAPEVSTDLDPPTVEPGEVIARLEIPAIGKDLYVVAGVTPDDLKKGPGWYPDSSFPGRLGNAAIAGHRTTYGAPFFDVDQLREGDEMVVTTTAGDRYVYRVTGVDIVDATDYWVVTTRDPDIAELTLTSCHPKYTARERIVVHSLLVPELSSVPETTAPETTAPETTAPETTTPATTTPETTSPATTAAEERDPTTTVTAPAAASPPVTTEPVEEPVEDAAQAGEFGRGWFDDDEAWPQIALWAGALTVVALLAYQVSKRNRSYPIGVLAGIAPFLVCLYFFYQNVNRLLPPGF